MTASKLDLVLHTKIGSMDRGIWERSGNKNALWLAAGLFATISLTTLAVNDLPLAGGVLAVLAFALIAMSRPSWMFVLFLVSAFTSMPEVVPRIIPLLGVGIYLYEPFLYVGVVYLLARRPGLRLPIVYWVFAAAWVYMLALGLFADHDKTYIVADARPILDMLVGAIGAFLYLKQYPLKPLFFAAKVILWVSLVLTLGSSILGVGLAGRAEVASLTGAQEGAERLITAATYFSLAVACLCLAALVVGASSLKTISPYLVPALVILFISFSRNNLLAIAVALTWAFLASRSIEGKFAGTSRLLGFVLVTGLALVIAASSGASPWLQEQLTGFGDRVLGGLSNAARAVDGSALFRVTENEQILPKIQQNPLWGYGFGSTYKEAYGAVDSFYATRGPSYAHQFYYWITLKGGAVTLAAFLLLVVRPILSSFRSLSVPLILVASTLLALAVVSVFAPMPVGFPTAVLFGLLIGAAHFFAAEQKPLPPLIASRTDAQSPGAATQV